MKKINLDAIRIDGGTQPRERIDMATVTEYAEAIKAGADLPPVIVFHDGADNWLADGFHRWHGHKQADKASILADVRAGSLLDAKLFAVGANGAHGLRRTNEDKRRAVQMVLDEPAWKDWSDRNVAEACGVSHTFVAQIRRPAAPPADAKKPARVATVATYPQDAAEPDSAQVARGKTGEPKKTTLPPAPAPERGQTLPPDDDQLAEAQHASNGLAAENEELRDRLAVEAMDASEDEKTMAAQTIAELRARVKTLEAENAALKVSRDTYQREASEAKKDAIYWRKQADKLGKVVA